ncbi:hypothetical protein HPB50_024583 [Hyalomma asiaticum]|uniref:Uncharacterized protein n=1 Tax=Hyalomma asiaticum TaxID=266040 RepID=A0ACB7SZG4_HYAAI|nr:hypothetical protein HPB50_024583 [Hyalomma asiaticum]
MKVARNVILVLTLVGKRADETASEPDDRSFHSDPCSERAPTIVPDPGSPEELSLPLRNAVLTTTNKCARVVGVRAGVVALERAAHLTWRGVGGRHFGRERERERESEREHEELGVPRTCVRAVAPSVGRWRIGPENTLSCCSSETLAIVFGKR